MLNLEHNRETFSVPDIEAAFSGPIFGHSKDSGIATRSAAAKPETLSVI